MEPLLARKQERVDDVVIYGCGRIGIAVARMLLGQEIRVRMIEANAARAREVAEELPRARVFNATGMDPDFLERERVGHARAAIFAMRDDAKNHYAAALAKLHGVGLHDRDRPRRHLHGGLRGVGVDVAINPRAVTAEEIVRFAHDPRTQQVAMLEGDRYEVLDIVVRRQSELVNTPFKELPITGALIGAIVRNGEALFPHGQDVLLPDDRVIVFTESVARDRGRAGPVTLSAARLRRAVRRETVRVDVRAALNLVGSLVRYLSIAYLLPIAFALGYREPVWPFVAPRSSSPASGSGSSGSTRGGSASGCARASWWWRSPGSSPPPSARCPTCSRAKGQLSATRSNAYFEAMSGFTTTGASVLTDVPALSHSLAMWRQFTQWLGGMGIIVLALAVLPRLRVGGRQLFESEAPGPEADKLAASIRETARRLWLLYVALTALMVAALTVVGWTGSTTPWGRTRRSRTPSRRSRPAVSRRERIPSPSSAPPRSGSSIVFMALAGTNFALLFAAIVQRRRRQALRDHELRLYFSFLVLGALVLLVELVAEGIARGETAFRQATFEAVSTMTTTGAADADYVQWTRAGGRDPGRVDVHRRLGRLDRRARSRSSATC